MNIVVFGANGRVGRLVVNNLVGRDITVTAFVHGPAKLPRHKGLKIVQGDVRNPADVDSALRGNDAVISTLGSWGTKSKDILSAGMGVIVPAAEKQGISRLVSLTGADAWADSEKNGIVRQATHFGLSLAAPKILKDGEKHIQILESSKLNWVVLRSPVMVSRGNHGYKFSNNPPKPWSTINRQDVADAMVELALSKKPSRTCPFITRS